MLRRLTFASVVVLGGLLGLLHSIDAALVGPQRALLTIAPPSWAFGAPNNAASLDFDFANNRYWQVLPVYGRDSSTLLSVVRASTEYQADLSGLLHVFPANVASVTNAGLGSWQATTNEALYSRDLTQTQWVKVNATAAHTATGADGATNAGSLLTAGAANATVLQTFTIASEAQNLSVYIQRVTGSGEIDITENNGTTWTPLTSSNCYQPGTYAASGIVTTGYIRCSVEATVLNPVIGFRIVTNGDAINIDFVKLENNTFPTPPCQSSGSTCTTAADVLSARSFIPPFSNYFLGAVVISGTPSAFASSQFVAQIDDGTTNNRGYIIRTPSTGTATFDVVKAGTSNQKVFGTLAQNITSKVLMSIADGSQQWGVNGAQQGNSYPAAVKGFTNFRIGTNQTGTFQFNGIIKRLSYGLYYLNNPGSMTQ